MGSSGSCRYAKEDAPFIMAAPFKMLPCELRKVHWWEIAYGYNVKHFEDFLWN